MITLELSTIQCKDIDRAMIAAAMAEYCGEIEVLGVTQAPIQPGNWRSANGISLPGSSQNSVASNREAALERRILEMIAKGAGMTSMKKTLGTDARLIKRVAERHGVAIPKAYGRPKLEQK